MKKFLVKQIRCANIDRSIEYYQKIIRQLEEVKKECEDKLNLNKGDKSC